jgi:hypothetical protein
VGFLLLHHLLRIQPMDAELFAIDPLEPLPEAEHGQTGTD